MKPNERSYKSFKEFFDKVNESKEIEEYTYAYVLLFSFFEDRVKRIFTTQFEVRFGGKPTEDDFRTSIHHKLKKCNKWGLSPKIGFEQFTGISTISKSRNRIIHDAMFHINSITKNDVEFLEKVGRYFDKVRKKQKENHPELFPKKEKVSARDRLRLRFSSSLPSLSSLREVKL